MRSWGFEGEVEFLVADNARPSAGQQKDEVLADFLKPDLAAGGARGEGGALGCRGVLHAPIKLRGLVSDKTLSELPTTSATALLHALPALWRALHGRRAAPVAPALPRGLYTEKTVQEVIEAHKGEHIRLAYDWERRAGANRPQFRRAEPGAGLELLRLRPVVRLGAGRRLRLRLRGRPVHAARTQGRLGEPVTLRREEVSGWRCSFQRSSATRWRCSTPGRGPREQAHGENQAVAGVRQDVLLRTPISDEAQQRVQREKRRLLAAPE